MNVRWRPTTRFTWSLLLAAAALVPSCGGRGGSSSGPGTAGSANPSVSADGKLVAFDSTAALGATGESSGGRREIFLFDRSAGTTRQLSQGQGSVSNGDSSNPVISADGHWVAFQSTSSTLAGTSTGSSTTGTTGVTTTGTSTGLTTGFTTAGTTAATTGVATTSGTTGFTTAASSTTASSTTGSVATTATTFSTTMASTTMAATTTASATTAGTTVSTTAAQVTTGFATTGSTTMGTTPTGGGSGRNQVFVTNVGTGQTRLVSGGVAGDFSNGDSVNPSISANGQMIAFESNATNMISGTPTATSLGRKQVFVWNMASNQIQLVSVTPAGNEPDADSTHPSISADGRFVGFQSAAGNIGIGSSGSAAAGRIRILLRDLQAGTTTIVTPDPASGTPALDGDSANPSLSGDGRFVAFESTASNLPSGGASIVQTGHTNIFVWDRLSGHSVLASLAASPGTTLTPGDADSHNPSLSGDGRFVAFDSKAGNLLGASTTGGTTPSTTGGSNVFLRDLQAGTTILVSRPGTPGTTTTGTTASTARSTSTSAGTTSTASAGTPQGNSANPAISQDGAWVSFVSDSSGLASGSMAAGSNIFLANPSTGSIILVTQAPGGMATAGGTTGTTGGTTAATTGATTGLTTGFTTAGTTAATTGVATTGGTTGFTTAGTTAATTGVTTTGVTTGFTTTGTTAGTTGVSTTGMTTGVTTGFTTATTDFTTGFSTGGTTAGTTGGTTFGTTGTTTFGTTTFGTTSR